MIAFGLRARAVTAWRWLLYRFEPVRWLIEPGDMSGKKVCLLASFAADDALSRHTIDWCEAWHRRGFAVVLVVATNRPSRLRHDIASIPFLTGLLPRRNIGYDFGSWVCGLSATPGIRRASLLAMANDSVYGPLDGFDDMLSRVYASTSDVIGVTESFELTHHLQSFLVFYQPKALASAAFEKFWKRMPTGGREEVIRDRELKLMATMQAHGLAVDALFPSDRSFTRNPTLVRWRQLVDAGCPFVKVQLLRDNPTLADIDGWQDVLQRHGFDPARVEQHLSPRFEHSAAGRSIDKSKGMLV
jgi:hypothetical protein